jgi:hypothetical protein
MSRKREVYPIYPDISGPVDQGIVEKHIDEPAISLRVREILTPVFFEVFYSVFQN